MRRQLEAIVDELKRLKSEGARTVSLSSESVGRLREALEEGGLLREERGGGLRGAATGSAGASRPAAGEKLPDLPAEKPRAPAKKKAASTRMPKGIAPIPSEPPVVELPEGDKATRWAALRERVLNCPVCNEHVRSGCRVVFGVGNVDADLFFVGEAPGAEEEKKGEPFVGPAGELLTRIIGAMGLSREQVYIGNIMNWRPETGGMSGNRPPTAEEMAFCLPYLRAQIEIVRPKILIALGGTAVTGLLGPDPNRRIGKVRGTWSEFAGIPLMITYHPSYVLRYASNRVKRTVWEDMLQVMERAGYEVSDQQRKYFKGKS